MLKHTRSSTSSMDMRVTSMIPGKLMFGMKNVVLLISTIGIPGVEGDDGKTIISSSTPFRGTSCKINIGSTKKAYSKIISTTRALKCID